MFVNVVLNGFYLKQQEASYKNSICQTKISSILQNKEYDPKRRIEFCDIFLNRNEDNRNLINIICFGDQQKFI